MMSVGQHNSQKTEQLTEKTLQNGGTFHLFHEEEIGKPLAKNIARTDRRQLNRMTSAIWRIFAILNNPLSPKHAD